MSDQRAVLVVDDNESTRYVLSHWLRRANFRVDEATNGAEALSAVAAGGYDLILLDVNLPDMTGPSVCATIKSDPVTSLLPVIHVSATAVETTDRTAGLQSGADAYLIEPLERDELLATVQALLRLTEARQRVEALAGRLTLLHRASLELNAAPDLDALAVAAARAARAFCEGPAAAGASTDAGGRLALSDRSGDPRLIPLALNDLHALMASPAATLSQLAPASALAGYPVRVFTARGRGSTVSGFILDAVPAAGDEALESALHQLAQTVAVAAENLQLLTRERHVAETLQRSLLGQVPSIPWLEIAVRYIPSASQMEVGGDFYDVIRLDDDRVAVVVGDIEGHSLHSATVMATVRHSLSAYLLAGRPPGVALDLLDHVLRQSHPDTTATVCCVVLTRDGRATIANGGHLPPILKSSHATQAVPARGTLLGTDGQRSEMRVHVAPGDTIVQFTDGLVERRGHSIAEGLSEATTVVRHAPAAVEAICDELLDGLSPARSAADDIAIVAVRLAP